MTGWRKENERELASLKIKYSKMLSGMIKKAFCQSISMSHTICISTDGGVVTRYYMALVYSILIGQSPHVLRLIIFWCLHVINKSLVQCNSKSTFSKNAFIKVLIPNVTSWMWHHNAALLKKPLTISPHLITHSLYFCFTVPFHYVSNYIFMMKGCCYSRWVHVQHLYLITLTTSCSDDHVWVYLAIMTNWLHIILYMLRYFNEPENKWTAEGVWCLTLHNSLSLCLKKPCIDKQAHSICRYAYTCSDWLSTRQSSGTCEMKMESWALRFMRTWDWKRQWEKHWRTRYECVPAVGMKYFNKHGTDQLCELM